MSEFQDLVDYISNWNKAMQQSSQDIEAEMEKLDMNSKDYLDLEFEYNWTAGCLVASGHFLAVADEMINKINKE